MPESSLTLHIPVGANLPIERTIKLVLAVAADYPSQIER